MGSDKQPAGSYDVAILGGGLAGLTLGLQLKHARPETSIFIAEKHLFPAPEAAFKVGESTVEVSAHYFGEVLGLSEHLKNDQLPKFGLRWWFPADDNRDLAQRIERGINKPLTHPSFQLDRGRFENHLADKNWEIGNDLFAGARVQAVEMAGDRHQITGTDLFPDGFDAMQETGDLHRITFTLDGETLTTQARWVVDATGRAFTLKKTLGLLEDNGHNVNSSWFRLAGGLDIEEWADPDDEEFFGRMPERGLRRFSTNHLCGKGYWVWLIPLSSGPISIGIVADPRFHPWEEINTLDGALAWIREHEPQLGASLDGRSDQIEDFLKVENFSYGCKQEFSGSERWCLVGEAGPFLDPFYSPGSDFIAMSNTFTTDLITRELNGEDVTERAKAHNDLYLSTYGVFLTFYEGQYEFWDNPLVMTVKICANNILYWGVVCLLFFHEKLTDVDFMESVRPSLDRIWGITRALEAMYREWNVVEPRQDWMRRAIVPTANFPAMFERHVDMAGGFDDETVKAKLDSTADLMEAFAVMVFHRAVSNLGDAAPGEDEKINPYAISLDPERWERDGLFDGSGYSLAEAREHPAAGIKNLFMEAVAKQPV